MALILGSPPNKPVQPGVSSNPTPGEIVDSRFSGQTQAPAATQQRKQGVTDPRLNEMAQDIASLTRRFRVLEERYINMRKRVQLMDQNILTNNKKVINEVKNSEEDIKEMGRKITDMKEKFVLLAKDIEGCAKKSDVDVVKRYIEMWNPVNFITQREAEKLIRQVIVSEKTGKQLEQYPVYEPEDSEENETEVIKNKISSSQEKTQEKTEKEIIEDLKTKKEKQLKSRRKEVEAAERNEEYDEENGENKEPEQENNYEDSDSKINSSSSKRNKKETEKVDLDDITNILHRHTP